MIKNSRNTAKKLLDITKKKNPCMFPEYLLVCKGCGKYIHARYNSKYCPECRAKQKKVMYTIICTKCGKIEKSKSPNTANCTACQAKIRAENLNKNPKKTNKLAISKEMI
jgi:hypothetical protein